MSNERTFFQAVEEMKSDPARRYSCGGNTYRYDPAVNRLMFEGHAGGWLTSRGNLAGETWYRLLSEAERTEAWNQSLAKQVAAKAPTGFDAELERKRTESAMQVALDDREPRLNICSSVSPPAPKNPDPKKAFGATKPNLSLIPPVALLHMAMAFEVGAAKYGAFNWRKDPVEAMTYIAAQGRHGLNFLDGEDISSDDVHNLAQVMACCAIVLDAIELGTLIDNRPPKGNSSQVQDRMMAQKKAKLALVKKAV